MALAQSSEALRRPQKVLWFSFPLVALMSIILGYLGLRIFLADKPDYGHRFIDLCYYDLQLFVLGSDPLQTAGPYPRMLDIARFSAPAVTIYAAIEAARLLLSVEFSRVRARHARQHAIVCGDSTFADALTRRLRAGGKSVVEVRTEVDDFVTPGEPLRIIGDARDPDVLRSAGLDHADALYACAGDGATNISIALAADRAARPDGGRLSVYSLVHDPDFCATVQAFFLGRPGTRRVKPDFFNIDHIAARRLFRDDLLARVDTRPPRMLIADTNRFAQAAIVEAARCWRAGGPAAGELLPLTLVGDDAVEVVLELKHRYPFLAGTCDLATLQGELLPLIQRGRISPPPDQVLITYPDEEYALKTAMMAERHWRGRSRQITVRLDGALIGAQSSEGSLSLAPGNLRAFGVVGAAADPDLIRDDLTERIARVLHDRYVFGRTSRGEQTAGRSMVPWDRLPGRLRQANRSQAEDIGRKLMTLGYVITPRHVEQRPAILSESDLDQLAEMEHARWLHEQEDAGWRYAPELDEQRKLHPGLLHWEQLPDAMRLRNYDPVRDLPAILGDAGFQIVRV
jgi:hypothetical protein